MRLFHLINNSAIKVAECVRFTDGRCAVNWLTKKPGNKQSSIAFYDNIEHIIDIHGTQFTIVFLTEDVNQKNKTKPRQCYSEDPSSMCPTCDCWKMTRQLCS